MSAIWVCCELRTVGTERGGPQRRGRDPLPLQAGLLHRLPLPPSHATEPVWCLLPRGCQPGAQPPDSDALVVTRAWFTEAAIAPGRTLPHPQVASGQQPVCWSRMGSTHTTHRLFSDTDTVCRPWNWPSEVALCSWGGERLSLGLHWRAGPAKGACFCQVRSRSFQA